MHPSETMEGAMDLEPARVAALALDLADPMAVALEAKCGAVPSVAIGGGWRRAWRAGNTLNSMISGQSLHMKLGEGETSYARNSKVR
ncbi:hypothetical protein PR202_gb23804 [Eleusine coracana subsp. coracana]|uniref:Uncharacterized protein n=1 Tax=Eleusine coracana subsp. coracana TaxID=191504 RepID=A0AAV5FLC2_ELECO|nr:hypothetical protein PR202_gb23804 [Eleusine coracana subsp. coracana]